MDTKHGSHTTYAAYLADVRSLLLSQCTSSNRFFSMDVTRSAWGCAQPDQGQTHPIPIAFKESPLEKAKPQSLPLEPAKPAKPATLPATPTLSATPTLPALPTKSMGTEALQQQPSRRLALQIAVSVEPFPAGEWKERLAQLMPALKTYETPPLPFGEQLWGACETDFVVLFINPADLTALTERFVQSIQSALKALLSPIGCLPTGELSAWNARSLPGCTCMPLSDLELYLKEPLRKKMLWNALEKLHQEKMRHTTPNIEPLAQDEAAFK